MLTFLLQRPLQTKKQLQVLCISCMSSTYVCTEAQLTAVNAHVWFLLDNVAFILELRTFQDANESNGARSQAFRSTVLHIKILSWNVYRNS